MNSFTGIWTALVTPMFEDTKIDYASWERLCLDQKENGVTGLVIGGTTGESPTLTLGEKLELIRQARATLGPSFPLMAGSGAQSTKETLDLSLAMVEAGATSLLVVTPPYNKPQPRGLKLHYEAIAKTCPGVPICLYHVPSRTGLSLSAQSIAELTEIPEVFLVKEASGDLAFFSRSKNLCRKEVVFFSGDDPTFWPSLSLGGSGVISVLSNLLPGPMAQMMQAKAKGDEARGLTLHNTLFPLMEGIFVETNPAPIKVLLSHKGIGTLSLRLPLVSMDSEKAKTLISLYEKTLSTLQEKGAKL